MLRLLLLTILAIAAGTVVNTLLAWTCALWSPLGQPILTRVDHPSEQPPGWNGDILHWDEIETISGFGCEYRRVTPRQDVPGMLYHDSYLLRIRVETEAGWPITTWRSTAVKAAFRVGEGDFWAPPRSWGIDGVLFSNTRSPRRIPLTPDPWALLATSLPFTLWPLGLAVRCVRRRRSGRCVNCGYAVHPLPTCPECGAAQRL